MDIGTFAALRVLELREEGATLAWGGKRLLLPRKEEIGKLERGAVVVVFIGLGRDDRPYASMRLTDYLEEDTSALREGQKVELLVWAETELGFKAIVDHEYLGMLYHNEIFQPVDYGSELVGYVKKVRGDGKIDLVLSAPGYQAPTELEERILQKLRARDGFLELTDKTAPETIYDMFGVSKKKFKAALGGLYKARMVTLDPDGVRLAR